MTHGFSIAPPGVEIGTLFLPFGRLEGRGMRREERETPREEQGTRREEVFEGRKALSGWEGDGGTRLAGLIARRLAPAFFDN